MNADASILVTGGCGFIGSAVVRHLIAETAHRVINLDALTYAASPEALGKAADDPRYSFVETDIRNRQALDRVFAEHRPDAVMHLAAESHVDRSIDGPAVFLETNILGTFHLLEAARDYVAQSDAALGQRFRLHHVSTDEVYGSLGETDPAFTENHPYSPNSPYSASKAASDHLVRAWGETYKLPVLVSNCSNNYGPWQYPEKLIPVMIAKALAGETLPVYGDGRNVRDWLHVEDHARALYRIISTGKIGETYNVGGRAELQNIELVDKLCGLLDERHPQGKPHNRLIGYVTDRPGHDRRYAIDARKIEAELGWTPEETAESGLAATVDWYLDNADWWRAKADGRRRGSA